LPKNGEPVSSAKPKIVKKQSTLNNMLEKKSSKSSESEGVEQDSDMFDFETKFKKKKHSLPEYFKAHILERKTPKNYFRFVDKKLSKIGCNLIEDLTKRAEPRRTTSVQP